MSLPTLLPGVVKDAKEHERSLLLVAPPDDDKLGDDKLEDAGPLHRPGCQRPTLLVEGEKGLRYDPNCELVLFALSDEVWNGRWILDDDSSCQLLSHIDNLAERNSGDGYISKDDILAWIRKQEHHQIVHDMPSAVRGILTEQLVERTFKNYDKDHNGKLDKKEWKSFLHTLKHHDLMFLAQKSFQQFRAFYGRGIPDNNDSTTSLDMTTTNSREEEEMSHLMSVSSKKEEPPSRFQIGRDEACEGTWSIIPPGWLADLYYYSANNHPLHGIFACDPTNLLTSCERLAMESATILFSFTTERICRHWVYNEDAPVELLKDEMVFSLVVVTIPDMLMFYTLLMLFTCGNVNNAVAGEEEVKQSRCFTTIGSFTAYLLIFCGFACAAVSFKHCAVEHCDLQFDLKEVIVGRLDSYVIAWAMMVGIYFNPLVAWGNPDPSNKQCCLGDYIGLGQWRIEKQRFQAQCSNTLVHKKRSSSSESGCGKKRWCDVQLV